MNGLTHQATPNEVTKESGLSQFSPWILVLQLAPVVLTFSVLLAGLIYTLTRRTDRNTAKKLVILGLLLMLVARLSSAVLSVWLTRSFSIEHSIVFLACLQLATQCLSLLGLAMIIVAVFTGQKSERPKYETGYVDIQNVPDPDGNPFKAPSA